MSEMVPWPSGPSPRVWRPQVYTCALLSLISWSAAISTDAPSASTIPAAQTVKIPTTQDLRHALTSFVHAAWSLLAQAYNRAIQGRWEVWVLVQLMAVCGAVLGITVWRKRSVARNDDESKIRDYQSIGRSSVDSRTPRFWQASPKSGQFAHSTPFQREIFGRKTLNESCRCRKHRSRLAAKAFDLPVLHHIARDIPIHPNLLQTASPSR